MNGHLITHPDQLGRLRQDPELVGTAVEELLRLGSPIDVATERYARETVEVAGVAIPRGSLVLVGIVSANTDGERFPEPERLDLAREDNHHVAFGLGPNYCLAVAPEQLRWRASVLLRGLVSLPVRW